MHGLCTIYPSKPEFFAIKLRYKATLFKKIVFIDTFMGQIDFLAHQFDLNFDVKQHRRSVYNLENLIKIEVLITGGCGNAK